MKHLLALVFVVPAVSQSGQCPTPPDNGGCCTDCSANHFCPANHGCYTSGQPGCSGGYCPAPGPQPGPSPPPPSFQSGHFLVIGDWGFDSASHGNINSNALQKAIAAQMEQKFAELGDVKFIVNVGDSFYPTGVTSKTDAKWQTRWRDIYAPDLRSVPWYSVYGNHDVHDDRGCACGSVAGDECAQLNSDSGNLDFFYMPSVNWYREHPELDVEVIGLDMNHVSDACQYGAAKGCSATCTSNLASRKSAAEELFNQRRAASTQKNLIVFSHYPTDFFRDTSFLEGLKDSSTHHIEYFGGHRHETSQSSTESIAPNNNWVVGGGGGWGCDSPQQGFVVGEIKDGGITTYAVYADGDLCNKMASEILNASKTYV